MSALIPFAFDSHAVRTLMIDNRPWFVGKDVALALGYVDPTNAIKLHCKGVAKYHPLQTIGGMQELRIIPEPDVYRLIISSHLPEAMQFERWVFEEVLPALRNQGRYEVVQAAKCDDPATIIAAIRAETSYAVKVMLHKQLQQCCRQRRLPLPSLVDITDGGELTPVHLFWQAVLTIGRQARIQLNHSRIPTRRAYEYAAVRHWAKNVNCPLPKKTELIQSLKHDRRFLGEKEIASKLRRYPVRCWVFLRHVDGEKRHGR